jgi:hypothetical protein
MNPRKQYVPTNLRSILEPFGLCRDRYELFLEILISQHSNMVGVFKCPKGYLCADLKWELDVLQKALSSLVELHLVYNDESKSLIMLDPTLGMNPIESYKTPQQVEMAVKVLHYLPQSKIYKPLSKHLHGLNKPLIRPVIKKLNSLCGIHDNE